MAPIVPDRVDCLKLQGVHPACPDPNPDGHVLATSDGLPDEDSHLDPVTLDDPKVVTPEEGDPAMAEEGVNDWPDQGTEDTSEDVFEESTKVAIDGLPHPASPGPHDQGEMTTVSSIIRTQSLDKLPPNNILISDLAGNHLDTETDPDWGVVASIVCIVLGLAVLTGE